MLREASGMLEKNQLMTVALDGVPEDLREATMRKIATVLVIAALSTGCADGKFQKSSITGGPCAPAIPTGYTYTGIAYGDSKMAVIPVSQIRGGTEWRFYLLPIDSLGGATQYGNAMVTIDGKPPPPPQPTPPATDDWIDASGTYNTATVAGRSRYIALCVPNELVRGQDWRYEVTIDTVGTLDPRGHVER
jgi:hypothetical protein